MKRASIVVVWILAAAAAAHAGPVDADKSYRALQIQPKFPAAKGIAPATKLVYMFADDKVIWAGAKRTWLELLKIKDVNRARSFVFADRPHEGAQFFLLGDADHAAWRSAIAPGVTAVQSVSPILFAKILRWTFGRNPSRYRYLQIDSHGIGPLGLGTDERQTDAAGRPLPQALAKRWMTLAELRQALRDGMGGSKLDLLFFNACMMSNVEALYEISPVVRFAVGSSDGIFADEKTVIDTVPWAFERLVREGKPPEHIAGVLAGLATTDRSYPNIARVDLAIMPELTRAMSQLVAAANRALARNPAAILRAYDTTPRLAPLELPNRWLGDLWTLLTNLMAVDDKDVQAAAKTARDIQGKMIGASWDSLARPTSISIVMPTLARLETDLANPYYPKDTKFHRDTGWSTFLRNLVAANKAKR
jgi:hypothetical protein